ncbi:MAG: cytochrome b/b6 domain-containing protein [Alphaproteobacteria bacterium]|nr:cytochrome b/b6 domain-containing protein [Alphaproteobacteria bacterium]NNF23182.1 cytochrome B [Paracoccaceae bacterium]
MAIPTGYSRAQIALHWITAALVAAQLVLHDPIEWAFDKSVETGAFVFTAGGIAHLASGTLVLGLVMWRLILRNERGAPAAPAGEPDWAKRVSRIAHLAFYALLLALPITGAATWGVLSETGGDVHETLSNVLFALILAHVGAVLVHQFVWKTGLIRRMVAPEDDG